MPLFQNGHALVIGISDYKDPALRLAKPVTAADAVGIADSLQDPTVAAYPPDQVHLLPKSGFPATLHEISLAFQELGNRVGPSDTAFISFSGHGVLGEDGEYYLTTEDTVLTAGRRVKSGTGLAKTKLLQLLRAIKARKVLLVINACFSGHVGATLSVQEAAPSVPPSSTMGVELLATGEGRAVITACRPTQYSYFTSQDSNSYFGQALIDGLRGKTVGHGGYIGLFEIYQYVYEAVRAKSGGNQDPVLTLVDGVGPFPIALHQGEALKALDPTAIDQQPPKGASIDLVKPAVTKAFEQGPRPLNMQAGGNISIDQSFKVFDVGSENNIGSLQTGDIVVGSMTKINITTTIPADVRDENLDAVLKTISSIRDDLVKLADVPPYDRRDAADELLKALEAGADKLRMIEKLETAQKYLLKIGSVAEGGIELAKSVGVLIQRLLRDCPISNGYAALRYWNSGSV